MGVGRRSGGQGNPLQNQKLFGFGTLFCRRAPFYEKKNTTHGKILNFRFRDPLALGAPLGFDLEPLLAPWGSTRAGSMTAHLFAIQCYKTPVTKIDIIDSGVTKNRYNSKLADQSARINT